MIDRVFAMGCSFVQGSELGPDNRNLPNYPIQYVPGRFSRLVADHFGASHINLAQGGAGQSRIFRTTVDWLNGKNLFYPPDVSNKLISKQVARFNPKDKMLFIIGLSIPLRQEIWVNRKQAYEKWNVYSESEIVQRATNSLDLSGEEFEKDYNKFIRMYMKGIHNEEESIRETYRYISALLSMIRDRSPNSKIFIFNSLGDNLPEYVIRGLNLDNKYLPSWEKYAYKNQLMDMDFSHPKELAHKELAEHIIKKYE